MKTTVSLSAFLISIACLSISKGAIVASYNFTTDLTSGDSEATSIASQIQSGRGIGDVGDGWGRSSSMTDLFVRSAVVSTSLAADDYVSFTVTTNPGVSYNFTSLTFKYSAQITAGGAGPFTSNVVVRSSLDSFATNLGSFTVTRVNVNGINILSPGPSVDLSSFTNASGAIEFRIYVYDDMDNTGDLTRLDNITLNATVVPEPSGLELVAMGSLMLGRRRRR